MRSIIAALVLMFSLPAFAMDKPEGGFNTISMQGIYAPFCRGCKINGNNLECRYCRSPAGNTDSGPQDLDLRFCVARTMRTYDAFSPLLICSADLYGDFWNHCKDVYIVGHKLLATCRDYGKRGSGFWIGDPAPNAGFGFDGFDLNKCRDKRVDWRINIGLACEPK